MSVDGANTFANTGETARATDWNRHRALIANRSNV